MLNGFEIVKLVDEEENTYMGFPVIDVLKIVGVTLNHGKKSYRCKALSPSFKDGEFTGKYYIQLEEINKGE